MLSFDRARSPRIFLFASASELRAYHDGADGFYQPGLEHDYIVLHEGAGSNRAALHEFTHLVLASAPVPLPQWLNEGLAELYSTLEISSDRLRVGEPILSHLDQLRRARWLSAAELAAVTPRSPGYADHNSAFYAESWALVHMLNLAPAWRDGMPRFVLALTDGRDLAEAFQSAFGKSLDDALAELHGYLNAMHAATLDSPQAAAPEIHIESLSADRATLALFDLALQTNRHDHARRLIRKLSKPLEAEAALALSEGREEAALDSLDRAIALGARDAFVYYDYAMLQRDRGASAKQVEDLLRQAIALDPEFADARFLLGVRQTDEGDPAAAIENLEPAARVRPGRSDYWHALGYAQWKLGRAADALASARRAVAVAENETQEQMARALADLVQTPIAPPPPRRADVTPPGWTNPQGDSHVEGTLIRFDCDAGSAAMLIRDAGGTEVLLNLRHPRQIELVNAPPDFQFPCGTQSRPVSVDYLAAGREVTRIAFPRVP